MKTKILMGTAVLGLALVAGAAYAMGHGGRGKMMQQMISTRIADAEDYIDATPEQRAVIEQSKQTILSALKARHQSRQGTHAKTIDMLTADKLDTDALYALATQHAQDIQDLAKVIVPEIQKVHDALTPAQRQKLAAKAKSHASHMQGGFGGPGE
jgi:Spy/CpxP family protein refolding chaperone